MCVRAVREDVRAADAEGMRRVGEVGEAYARAVGGVVQHKGHGGNGEGRRTADLESVEAETEVGSVDALADLPGVFPGVSVHSVSELSLSSMGRRTHARPRPTSRMHCKASR